MADKDKKKATKVKIQDLKPKKQVKGGVSATGDPCDGGEVVPSRIALNHNEVFVR